MRHKILYDIEFITLFCKHSYIPEVGISRVGIVRVGISRVRIVRVGISRVGIVRVGIIQ